MRLTRFYRPYHAALTLLVQETIDRFGVAVVVDCHSMPSALTVPDIVLGDRFGASAPASLTMAVERAFAAAGFRFARNTPYAGGYTTIAYGRGDGCHALQIEINRSLYMVEYSVTRRPGFDAMRQRLNQAIVRLVATDLTHLRRHGLPQAAE
jgi:N-formylglutamate amidohydrolase